MKRSSAAALFVAFTVGLSAADRPIVAVLDFQVDQVSPNEMKTLVSLLSSALFETGQFTVIDVARRDSLLKEIEFSARDCADESCQIEIGRLLSAEYVVVGRLGKIGRKFVISSKLLETSTSKTARTADGIYDDLEAMVQNLPALARKLAGAQATAGPVGLRGLNGRIVLGVGSGAGAVGCGVAAAILLVRAESQYRGPVSTAYAAYMAEPEGSVNFDALYQSYLGEFGSYQGKLLWGLGLAAGAVAFAGGCVVFLALPAPKVAGALALSVAVWPDRGGTSLMVRAGW